MNMFTKIACVGILLLLLVPAAFGQETGTISGVVYDADSDETIPGANVLIVETGEGTATDTNGEFTLSGVTASATPYTLRVTFLGYEPSEELVQVDPGEESFVEINLGQSAVGLEEVVVTALGQTQETRSLGTSMQEVEGEAVQNANESNLVSALSGKVSGVQITNSSGQPGKGSRIIIRGNSSLTGSNQPLFVVDGVPIFNTTDDNPRGALVFTGGTSNRGLDLDPSVIQDITVLKSASATALYGSRAANGAVIITTKGGQYSTDTGPRINVTSRVRWDTPVIDGYQTEYLQGLGGAYRNGLPAGRGGYAEDGGSPQTTVSWGPHKDSVSAGVLGDLAALEETSGVDLLDENGQIRTYDPREQFYRSGTVAENSIDLSGGSESVNYFLSVGDLRQEGIVPETGLSRTNVLAKFGTQLSDRLDVQTSVNYTRTENKWQREGNGPTSYLYGLNFAPINFDIEDYEYEDGSQRAWTTSFNNPNWLVENNSYESDVNRFLINANVSYDLLPWLTASERFGLDTYTDTRKGRTNIGTRGAQPGAMFDQTTSRQQVNSDLTLRAERDLTDDFRLNLLLGNNINSRTYRNEVLDGQELNIPGFFNSDNATDLSSSFEEREEKLIIGAYSQATLNFRDYAYLNLTARNDWSSTLPAENNSYFYPSASLSFIFTDAFDFGGSILNFGKLRAAAAQVGNDTDPYNLSTYYLKANPSDGVRGEITFPFRGQNGFQLDPALGNPELKPEETTEYEGGLELGFFADRLRLDAVYYNRRTKDQIFEVPVSGATGFDERLINAGEIENKGVELSLDATPLSTGSFQWNVGGNFSKNSSEVVELASGVDNIFLFGFTSIQTRILPEEDGYGVLWGSRYKRHGDLPEAEQFEGVSDDALLIDDEGYPIQADEIGEIGNVQPDWTGSLRSSLSWKGLSLSGLLDIRQGGDVLNFDQFYSVYYGTAEVTENRGTEKVWEGVNANTGEPNDEPVLRDGPYYRGFYTNTYENFVEDGSYVKLRRLSLSYALPQGVLVRLGGALRSASVMATGRNLWISSDFSYRDPEGSLAGNGNGQGFYHAVTPGTRSYSLTLSLGF